MTFARGVDVSAVQPTNINYAALATQGVSFLYAKCGNGNDAPDSSFWGHVKGAKGAGILTGAYHVGFPLMPDPSHPGREPEAQAQAHYQQSGGMGIAAGDLPPVLDLEWPIPGSAEWKQYGLTAAFVRTWALAYLAEAQKLWGVTPIHYSGFPDYIGTFGIDAAAEPTFSNYPLWVVDYPAAWSHSAPADDSLLVVPKPWSGWKIWQHCGGGMRLPGGIPVDGDVFNGDIAALKAFACGKQTA
jgi:GH25 family lysozyme M1 (1,4-beta-N-acetylmuramidase)